MVAVVVAVVVVVVVVVVVAVAVGVVVAVGVFLISMPSLRYQLHYKLMAAYPEWISGIECERFALENNFKGSNAGRRLRELENDGILERRLTAKNGKRYVEYRYLPRQIETTPVQQSLIEALK